ncbi:MAG: ABC transporter permease [Myxococcales bacterium]
MKALTTKLFRDIWLMRGAVFTIALVVASGVAAFVTLRGTWLSIIRARDHYYSAERLGDVFAQLERAPLTLSEDIQALPDVARVYTRVSGFARVPLEGLDEPAQAQIVSVPEDGKPPINGLRLISGRLPSPDRDDEAVLVEMFANTHKVHPGQVLKVIIEGRERMLRVVGIGMSPEFVLSVPNGAQAPAPERFAVLWMTRKAVEAAYDMRGAFNSVVIKLAPAANPDATIQRLDTMLDRYGSLGAYGRERQLSNYFLTQDMANLAVMATMAPIIFLGVAAFLLNVVLSRLIELESAANRHAQGRGLHGSRGRSPLPRADLDHRSHGGDARTRGRRMARARAHGHVREVLSHAWVGVPSEQGARSERRDRELGGRHPGLVLGGATRDRAAPSGGHAARGPALLQAWTSERGLALWARRLGAHGGARDFAPPHAHGPERAGHRGSHRHPGGGTVLQRRHGVPGELLHAEGPA